MPVPVPLHVQATVLHRKASSACCGEKLRKPGAGAAHEWECAGCGQPAQRVLGEPAEVTLTSVKEHG